MYHVYHADLHCINCAPLAIPTSTLARAEEAVNVVDKQVPLLNKVVICQSAIRVPAPAPAPVTALGISAAAVGVLARGGG